MDEPEITEPEIIALEAWCRHSDIDAEIPMGNFALARLLRAARRDVERRKRKAKLNTVLAGPGTPLDKLPRTEQPFSARDDGLIARSERADVEARKLDG